MQLHGVGGDVPPGRSEHLLEHARARGDQQDRGGERLGGERVLLPDPKEKGQLGEEQCRGGWRSPEEELPCHFQDQRHFAGDKF